MAPHLTSLLVLLAGVLCAAQPEVDVNIERMVGRFYVVHVEPEFVSLTYENNTFCKTKDLTMLNETTLSVYSSETVGTSSSTPQGRYTATVTQTDSGSLIYHSLLKSTSFELYPSKIGEDSSASDDSQYEYLVLIRGNKCRAWVKDVETFNQVYKAEIEDFLKDYGFTVFIVNHNSSCNYPAMPDDSEESNLF